MAMAENDKPLSPNVREQLEMRHTYWRIIELELDPVHGQFNASHLKEVNRRIFQDLPSVGMRDVTPGEYRSPVPTGKDWMKNRVLTSNGASYFVAYSSMDELARTRIDATLAHAKPAMLAKLKTDDFAKKLATLYAELDYLHPFSDGNSRTLRTFTRQLAREAGYELAWERLDENATGRDLLYIARDISVNKLAKRHMHHEHTLRKVIYSLDRLKGNPALPQLLNSIIRPSRALAFEQLCEAEALQEHPELIHAYATLQAAAGYFAEKLPDAPTAQADALATVARHIQDQLDRGDVHGFRGKRPEPGHPGIEPGPDAPPSGNGSLGRDAE